MAQLNRVFLIKLHILLAAVILPAALMFFITGALYTWGEKGSYQIDSYLVALSQPIQRDKQWLVDLLSQELAKRELDAPSGKAKIKSAGNSFYFEWTGAKLDVVLEPTGKPLVAKLQIKKPNWHRVLVQLHKAKAGVAFKVYAAFVAVSLLMLFFTGFMMAWQLKKYRPLLIGSTSIGILLFILIVFIS